MATAMDASVIAEEGKTYVKRVARRERRPYIKRVKVPIVTKRIIPITKEVMVTSKKLIEVTKEEQVEEKYTVMEEQTFTRKRKVWRQEIVEERYTKRVPVTKSRWVRRPVTTITEQPETRSIDVEATQVQEERGWRIDEIQAWRWVEVEASQEYRLVPVGDETEVGEQRDLGEVQQDDLGDNYRINRVMGTKIFYSDDAEDLSMIPEDRSLGVENGVRVDEGSYGEVERDEGKSVAEEDEGEEAEEEEEADE